MKRTIRFIVAASAVICAGCAEKAQPVTNPVGKPEERTGLLSLEEVARIMSELPMQEEHLAEVHDAVCSSSGNGYDEEYMMSDMFAHPGYGVGEEQTRDAGSGAYGNPLRSLFENYFKGMCSTRGGGDPEADASDYIDALCNSDMQIYWPYSEQWDGSYPIITFDPGYGAESNTGYEIVEDGQGNRTAREIYVDESVAASRTVWVINTNDDSAFTPAEFFKVEPAASSKGEGESRKMLILKSFKMLRNYDSWFGGGSEFLVKCGSASGFKATSMEDLLLYTPSVTDFLIVIRRSQLKQEVEKNTILVSDFTEDLDKLAFLVIEDDGGTTTSWKCSATVKYQSKSYGFDIEIPYKDKDDIVWRGQLSGDYFRENGTVTGRFGDVMITFSLI